MKVDTGQKILYIVESLIKRLREKRNSNVYSEITDVCKITVGDGYIKMYFTKYGIAWDAYHRTYREGWDGHYNIRPVALQPDDDFWEWRDEVLLTHAIIRLMKLNHVRSINNVEIEMI